MARIKKGEISKKMLPEPIDFDETALRLETESVDPSYMAHVYHHLTNKKQVYDELNRITRRGCRHFTLGVTLEDLETHPLNEFFPTKYEYEIRRYSTEVQIREIFSDSGFTYEKPFRIREQFAIPIDGEFLASIENTSQDSALNIMRDEDLPAFQDGLKKSGLLAMTGAVISRESTD